MEQPTPSEDKDPFKYERLTDTEEWFKETIPFQKTVAKAILESPELSKAATAFIFGLVTTHQLARLPLAVATVAAMDTYIEIGHALKNPEWQGEELCKKGPRSLISIRGANHDEEFHALVKNELTTKLPSEITKKVGLPIATKWIERNDDNDSFMAIYRSIIIESWLYFEVFAGDFWWEAVNHGAPEFKQRANSSKLRKQSGDLKPIFSKLDTIREAYDVILDRPANTNLTNDIVLLSKIRNVLVHKAGIVDQRFLDEVKGFPEFETLPLGKSVKLDGELVARLRKASIDAVHELLTRVLAIQDPAPVS